MIKEVTERINNQEIKFDVLGDILDTLRFRGSIFFRSKLAAPWGMSLEKIEEPRFHIALRGNCVIGTGDSEKKQINLEAMDIVMLPHGDMHWIADQDDRDLTPSEQAGEACELGSPLFQQGEITHNLICGLLRYDKDVLHPILDSLPSILHFSEIEFNDPIWTTVTLIEAEMQETHMSRTSIVDRLTEVLFLQLLNKYMNEDSEISGFFAALRNRRIHRLLELIHQHPQFEWTLESLGERVGMSRATLARQFKNSVGVPPMTYIADWRMMKAHHLLKYSSSTVDGIAEQVGFTSAHTLNKAFQRHYGFTPSELRRRSS
jgi:AraC-like DNA-binding protein